MRTPSASDPRVGATIANELTLRAVLRRSATGVVYRADQRTMAREVAVKLLSVTADPDTVARFMHEARGTGRLGHPHLVTVFDVGQTRDGLHYLVTELLEGRVLEEELWTQGPLAPERAVRIMSQVCDAVGHAHSHGMLHGDLCPANVLLVRSAREDFVKVLDFAVAPGRTTQGRAAATRIGRSVGAPWYMSPEQIQGDDVDVRSDVYALGVMAYELLAGRRPFDDDDSVRVVLAHVNEPPPRIAHVSSAHVPEALEAVVRQALAKSPSARPASCEALATALVRALASCRLPSPASRPATMGLASSLALAASGLALVATIGLTVAIASFSGDSSGGRAIEPSDVMHVGAAPVMPPAASVAPAADRPPAPPACVPPPGANLVAPPPTPSPIVVDSTPGGATVVVDGVRIGKTPLVVPRPTGETRVRLELKRAGYRPEVLVLTASGSDVAVELKRAPARTVQRDWDSGVIR